MTDSEKKDIAEEVESDVGERKPHKVGPESTASMSPAELAAELIKRLHLAIQKMEMYGSSHPITVSSLHQAYNFFRIVLDRRPTVTLSINDDGSILVDEEEMPKTYFTERFSRDFEHHRIHSLTFLRKLTLQDLIVLLKFLERRIGRSEDRGLIEEYLAQNKVHSIEVNKVRYRMVVDGEEAGDGMTFFRKGEVAELFAQNPEIIAALIRADSEQTKQTAKNLADVMPTIRKSVSEDEIIDRVIRIIEKQKLGKDETEIDRNINAIIDNLKRSLSDRQKEELRSRLEKVRDEIILDSHDKTAEYIEDERTLRRVGLVKEIETYIEMIKEGAEPEHLKNTLKGFLNSAIDVAEKEDVDNVYTLFVRNFKENPLPAFLGTVEVFVDTLFERADDSVVRKFSKERALEKQMEKNYDHGSEYLTMVLVWITYQFLKQNQLLSALQIARVFEKKKDESEKDSPFVADAKTFFKSLTIGEPLQALIDSIHKKRFDIPPEVEELFKLVRSARIPEEFLKRMENEDREYAIRVAGALKVIKRKAIWVFANEVKGIKDIIRDPFGNLLTDAQRRRAAGAMLALAILAEELAIPILAEYVEDKDPAVRFASIEAISRIESPKATKLLVRYLYTNPGSWEGDLLRLIPRMDPETAVPLLVRYFHTRKDKWLDIIRVLGRIGGPETREFLLETLDMWSLYVGGMDKFQTENFILALLEAINKIPPDPEMKRALKFFLSDWNNRDVVRGIAGIFNISSDRVTARVKEILAGWRNV
ncbi:hypothetical protein DRQ36_04140 [bacterium]|nr:MAG: hypothetical protein DRQ36_04140 [bacterium]